MLSDSITSICRGLAVRQVVQLVARLVACRTTCCGLVAQQAERKSNKKSKLVDSDTMRNFLLLYGFFSVSVFF